MRIYLVPQIPQVESLLHTLGALGLGEVHDAVMIDIEQIEQAEAVTRLLAAVEQPFEVIHPAAYRVDPAVTAWVMGDDHAAGIQPAATIQPGVNFHLVDLRPPEIVQMRLEPYHTPELHVVDELRHDMEDAQANAPDDEVPPMAPVITEAKASNVTLKEVVGGVDMVCLHCGDTWRAKRKDMRYCFKPECQAAKKESYKQAWRERYHNSLNKTGLMSDVITPEMREEQAMPQTLPEEPAAEEQPPEEEKPVSAEPKHWIRDNGKGVDFLSTSQVKSMLAEGALSVGQKLRHTRIGDCKVVKRTGGKGLALLRWYGTDSPMMVDFSDPIYA
jgi:hypothetical protein